MKNFFSRVFNLFAPQEKKGDAIVGSVVYKISIDHADSLRKLDLYDRGEIKETKYMANNPTVRDYLRIIQKPATYRVAR
jgi:hypothetical protein